MSGKPYNISSPNHPTCAYQQNWRCKANSVASHASFMGSAIQNMKTTSKFPCPSKATEAGSTFWTKVVILSIYTRFNTLFSGVKSGLNTENSNYRTHQGCATDTDILDVNFTEIYLSSQWTEAYLCMTAANALHVKHRPIHVTYDGQKKVHRQANSPIPYSTIPRSATNIVPRLAARMIDWVKFEVFFSISWAISHHATSLGATL